MSWAFQRQRLGDPFSDDPQGPPLGPFGDSSSPIPPSSLIREENINPMPMPSSSPIHMENFPPIDPALLHPSPTESTQQPMLEKDIIVGDGSPLPTAASRDENIDPAATRQSDTNSFIFNSMVATPVGNPFVFNATPAATPDVNPSISNATSASTPGINPSGFNATPTAAPTIDVSRTTPAAAAVPTQTSSHPLTSFSSARPVFIYNMFGSGISSNSPPITLAARTILASLATTADPQPPLAAVPASRGRARGRSRGHGGRGGKATNENAREEANDAVVAPVEGAEVVGGEEVRLRTKTPEKRPMMLSLTSQLVVAVVEGAEVVGEEERIADLNKRVYPPDGAAPGPPLGASHSLNIDGQHPVITFIGPPPAVIPKKRGRDGISEEDIVTGKRARKERYMGNSVEAGARKREPAVQWEPQYGMAGAKPLFHLGKGRAGGARRIFPSVKLCQGGRSSVVPRAKPCYRPKEGRQYLM
ncbi:hypothetical protein M413DRAFT_13921 [Hebeloma cylindrosporum]|uniref:Uncharacterized protein n=1 Tax=Hebeloma cylindrosporum TaxID=76867 RepID=A0A0C3BY74_HEBCY|nr:hypothetical protein M413DRAFT_13921 [Hebeloma cylindrosporum h7]